MKLRKQEPNCRRFDNTPGIRKHGATELFNERHALSALFCSESLAKPTFKDESKRNSPTSACVMHFAEIGSILCLPGGRKPALLLPILA